MSRRTVKYVGLVAVGIAFFMFAATEPTGILRGIARREAFFHNFPSSYWREYLRSERKDGNLSAEATAELNNMRAVRVLRECVHDADAQVRLSALELLATTASYSDMDEIFGTALNDSDPEIQYLAIRQLGMIGPNARGRSSEKIKALRLSSDPVTASAADWALWRIIPDESGQAPPWRNFTSEKWQFSASLPGEPDEDELSTESPFGLAKTNSYTAVLGRCVFGVAVTEFPPGIEEAFTVQQRYEWMQQEAPKYYKQKFGLETVCAVTNIEYLGQPAIETVIDAKNGTRMRSRSAIIGARNYMIQIVEPRSGLVEEDERNFFFDSLLVSYKPLKNAADAKSIPTK